ncbi:MAG: TM1812 family CRISPR-associated protein [Lachnospiraceae bacterium]|nr:TM1812 family CRISPR-associated protein [Lachnospiraceae bacterium]
MSNILIAQIGRGNYLSTSYMNGETLKNILEKPDTDDCLSDHSAGSRTSYITGYTFEAIIREISDNVKENMDYVVLIGTATSYFGTLLHYYYKKSIGEDVAVTPKKYEEFLSLPELEPLRCDAELESSTQKDGSITHNIKIKNILSHRSRIEELLTGYISTVVGISNLKVRLVIIHPGTNAGELEKNFNLLQTSVEHIMDEENPDEKCADRTKHYYNIFFDISNGFRSLPMYIYTFFNYLLRIRDEKFKLHMFYGMADGKVNKIAPIVNLENINGMMDWINAANEFHNYGSVRQLDRLLEENPELHTLFQQFDYASNANNLGVLKTTTEKIIKLKDTTHFAGLPHYAKSLLCKIGEEFQQEFDQEHCSAALKKNSYSYAYLTIHLAHWYMEQGRTGNAAIALQEGITTFMMERWTTETDHLIAASQSQPHGRYFEQNPVKWLFDFKNRSVISDLLKEKVPDLSDKIESGAELTLIEKMAAIRDYIRNPEAHILINQISDQIIEKSQQILDDMIQWMLLMTSEQATETEENQLFCYISGNTETDSSSRLTENMIKSYFKEINNLSHITHKVKITEPTILAAAKELEKDLIFIKSCQITSPHIPASTEAEKIHKLQEKLSSGKYLGKFLEKWLNYDPADHDKNPAFSYDECRKILHKNKKNRTTEQRIIGWIGTHGNAIADMILSEQNHV